MNRLADLFALHRTYVALAVILVTAAALVGTARISFDDEPRAFFRRDDANLAVLEQMFEDFGPDDNEILVVLQAEDLFTPESLRVIRRIVHGAAEVDCVESVWSILSIRRVGRPLVPLMPGLAASPERFARARRNALKHPLVAGQFLSDDARTMLIAVRIAGDSLPISRIEPVVDHLRRLIRQCVAGTSLRARLTGHLPLRVDILVNSRREYIRIVLLSTVIASAIAVMLFRRLAAVVISIAGPIVGVVWMIGMMGLTGQPLNGICVVLPTLLFVIGFTDAIHLMVDITRSRAAGLAPLAAATGAIRRLGLACSITSLTTAVGFGSLVLAKTEIVRQFGLVCAGGAALTLLAVITVIPLLASTPLGNHLLPRRGPSAAPSRLGWLAAAIFPAMKYPRLVSALGVVASLGFLISSFRMQSDIQWTETVPSGSETSQIMEHCDRVFGGALLAYVQVEWPEPHDLNSPDVLKATGAVHALFDDEPLTRRPLSVLNVLLTLPGSRSDLTSRVSGLRRVPPELLRRLLRRDLRRLVVTAHVPDVGAVALEPALVNLENGLAELEQRYPGFRFRLTGTAVVAARNIHRMIDDMARSLGLAAVVVFLIMTLAFRSIYLGFLSIIPNAFPLGLTASLLVWTGQSLRVSSVLTFSLCLGIAVDDTIHFLVRFRREQAASGDLRAAILSTFRAVGTALVMTSVILIGGFSAMMVSTMPMVRTFAGLSCAAILAALVGDLLILPALMLTFGVPKVPATDGEDEQSPTA